MQLYVDEEVQGNREEISTPEEMKRKSEALIDENVIEVTVKKRAVKDNSLTNGCSGNIQATTITGVLSQE